jgi:type I restriction enzyme S subunit
MTTNLQTYNNYKPSGVEWLGEIPEHWEMKRFKYISDTQKGKLPQKIVSINESNLPPYMSMEYLRGGVENQWVFDKNAKIIDEDEVLLLWDGSNAGEFIKSRKGVISSTVAQIAFKDINKNFAWYYSKFLEIELRKKTIGMGIPHVNGSILNNFSVLLPSSQEQTAITKFLDEKTAKIDQAITIKKNQIELLKERKHSLINKAVTKGINNNVKLKGSGVEWIGEIPEHWQVKRLKYVFQILKRISGELGHNVLSITQKGIKVKDTESGGGQLSMDYSKYQFVYKGDFAMNHMDLLTGYVDISKYDGVISPDYRVFDLIEPNSSKEYMLLLLQLCYSNKVFYAHGQGVSMLGRWRFPSENFNIFPFPVPPKSEQIEIADFIAKTNKKIAKAISLKEKEIDKLKEYKASLINSVVTGKVKVS